MAVYVKKEIFLKSLENVPSAGKRVLEPSKSFSAETGFPVKILEDSQVVNEGEIHENEGDLWQLLEGEVNFVCGGKLIDPKEVDGKPGEWKGTGIEGGKEIPLSPGDWLWIPPGEPHLHKTEKTARLVIVKIPKLF